MFLTSNGQFHRSNDDQLILQDQFTMKNSYESGS